LRYSEDQPRDDDGKFASSGGDENIGPTIEGAVDALNHYQVNDSLSPLARMDAQTAFLKQIPPDLNSAIGGWTAGYSQFPADVRTAINGGDTSKMSSNVVKAADALTEALSKSGPDAPQLYRGLSVRPDDPLLSLKAGDPLNVGLSSFSTDTKIAEGHALSSGDRAATNPHDVIISIAPGAHGLNVEPLAGKYADEHEWISGGSFTVDHVETKNLDGPRGGTQTTIHLTSPTEQRMTKIPWLSISQPDLSLPSFAELRESVDEDRKKKKKQTTGNSAGAPAAPTNSSGTGTGTAGPGVSTDDLDDFRAVYSRPTKRYSDDQPRDADGKFAAGDSDKQDQSPKTGEGFDQWRQRLWDGLSNGGKYDGPPVQSTGMLYRAVSDKELAAAKASGSFTPPIGSNLYVTDDPDRLAGGTYGASGAGHIIEINPADVVVHSASSQTVAGLEEKAVDSVPVSAVTKLWSWDADANDHILQLSPNLVADSRSAIINVSDIRVRLVRGSDLIGEEPPPVGHEGNSRYTPDTVNYRVTDNPSVSCDQCIFRNDNGDGTRSCERIIGAIELDHVCDLVELSPVPAGMNDPALRYSDDQPRDADGKFASGGSTPQFADSQVEPVAALADGKSGYLDANSELNAPGKLDIDYSKINADPVAGKAIAALYEAAPADDPAAHAAYDALAKEVGTQYDYLTKTLGVTVEVTKTDPYPSVKEMVADVRDNHHLAVLSTETTGPHPYLTNEQNDQFRAVHDAFGHAATGRGFDRNGEQAAWTAHMQMFSPLAGQALTTETRGQNSTMIYGSGSGFVQQKVFLLPDEYSEPAENRAKAKDRQATAQEQSDQDNLYSLGHSHHVSQGRHFPAESRSLRYSEDQPRDADGKFASGGSSTEPTGPINSLKVPGAGDGPRVVGKTQLEQMMRQTLADHLGKSYGDIGSFRVEGYPTDLDQSFKALASSKVADAMVAVDGSKWDDKFIQQSASFGDDLYDEIGGHSANGTVDNTLNHGTVVSPSDVDGRVSVDTITGMSHYVTGWPAVKSLMDSNNGLVTFEQLGQYQNYPDKAKEIAFARGDTLEALQMMRESGVSYLIQTWAGTSNDTSPRSLAMQESAKAEFGLQNTAEWQMPSNAPLSVESNLKDELKNNGDFYRSFLRAQYNETQSQLKSAGITEITLHRGQQAVTPVEKQFAIDTPRFSPKPQENTTRPLSSWSTNKATADDFAVGFFDPHNAASAGLVYSAVVPADRILSTPSSGFGCRGESEIVVLGGTDTVECEVRRTADETPGVSNG
jgi:hypothetical protein